MYDVAEGSWFDDADSLGFKTTNPIGSKNSAWTTLFSTSGVVIGEGKRSRDTVYRGVATAGSSSYQNVSALSRNRSGTDDSCGDGRYTTLPRSGLPSRITEHNTSGWRSKFNLLAAQSDRCGVVFHP